MENASPSNVNLADSRTILSFGQIDICSGEKVACDVHCFISPLICGDSF